MNAPSRDPIASPLPTLNAEAQIGLSVVCAIRNRLENLVKALPTWLAQHEIDEILLVDWGSTTPVLDGLLARGLSDPRLRVLRVEGEDQWCLTLAYNLGFRMCRFDRILKLDADICLSAGFFANHPLGAGQFYAGDWRAYGAGQEHLNGVFYIHRADLAHVGGFNEYIRSYGYDDDDLYARLCEAGFQRDLLREDDLFHLPHPDAARLGNTDAPHLGKGWQALAAQPIFHIRSNRILSCLMPKWCGGWTMQPFVICDAQEGHITLCRSGQGPHTPPQTVVTDSKIAAAREILSWQMGAAAFAYPLTTLSEILDTQSLDEIAKGAPPAPPSPMVQNRPTQARLFIDLHHGLGNRMRALASGLAIASYTARQPVIIWQPDPHCEARFSDLFENDLPVIETRFHEAATAMGMDHITYLEDQNGALPHDTALHLNDGRDAYVASACRMPFAQIDWAAETAALASLRPTREIFALLHPLPARFEIGLHIRGHLSEDPCDAATNWSAQSHARISQARQNSAPARFIPRLEVALRQMDEEVRLFLAADHPDSYEALFAAYGRDRFFTVPRQHYDRSTQAIQSALADMLALSRARLMLGSDWSSFSECAHRLASPSQRYEQAGRDF
jgi:hypothetical protein